SFEAVGSAFSTGATAVAARRCEVAHRAGATVVDLSGGLADVPSARRWIPALDAVLPQPSPKSDVPAAGLFLSPPAPVIVTCSLAAAFSGFALERLALVFFQPVSERGQAGIEELETQTIKLLSFQPIAREVFDAQVAFNLLDRYGEASAERPADARPRIGCEVSGYLAGRLPAPALQIVRAPVFYGCAFTAYAEFGSPA